MLFVDFDGNDYDNYVHIVSKNCTNIKELKEYSLSENKFHNNLNSSILLGIYSTFCLVF